MTNTFTIQGLSDLMSQLSTAYQRAPMAEDLRLSADIFAAVQGLGDRLDAWQVSVHLEAADELALRWIERANHVEIYLDPTSETCQCM